MAPIISDDRQQLLTRDATAAALTAAGYPIAAKTLAGLATRGGGPPYGLFVGRALYRWGAALDWANGRVQQRLVEQPASSGGTP